MKAKSFAAMFALLVLGVVSSVQSAGAAPPSCLVSNERTGLGAKSLQGAIDTAAAGDTLVVKGHCFGNSVIGKNLTLRGVNTKPFGAATLDGSGFSGSVLGIGALDAVAVSIDGLTITHGAVAGVTLGGFFSTRVELSNATVTGNGSGIGCQTLGCDVSLSDSTVSGNAGYGLTGSRSTYRLLRSTVADNGGLGIGLGRGGVSLTDSTVIGNGQGGISLFQASAEISASSVSGNDGSGIALNEGNISLVDSSVSNNGTSGNGGGINDFSGSVSLINSTVGGNSAGLNGGGIYLAGSVTHLALTDSTVSGNTAASGGGIYSNGGSVTLSGTNIFANNVPDDCVGVVGC